MTIKPDHVSEYVKGLEFFSITDGKYLVVLTHGNNVTWKEYRHGLRETGRRGQEIGLSDTDAYKNFIIEALRSGT